MIKFKAKEVVCDYGVFENEELKLILNSRSNAETIVNILNCDLEKKEYAVLMKKEIKIPEFRDSNGKCLNCGKETPFYDKGYFCTCDCKEEHEEKAKEFKYEINRK